MLTQTMSLPAWQKRLATDAACAEEIAEGRWPEGFRCAHCGHSHGWHYAPRRLYECARCHPQTSITAGTVFHGSRVPLHVVNREPGLHELVGGHVVAHCIPANRRLQEKPSACGGFGSTRGRKLAWWSS
jgi:DNA-directed RNA polymerase subunit RPC12/RpoP